MEGWLGRCRTTLLELAELLRKLIQEVKPDLQMPVQEVQHLTLAFGECSHGVNYYTNISPTSSFIRAASSSRAPTAGCGASGGCFCSQSSSASTAIGRASR